MSVHGLQPQIEKEQEVGRTHLFQLQQIIRNIPKGPKILFGCLQKTQLGEQQAAMKQSESSTSSGFAKQAILSGTVQVWQILHLLRDDIFLSLREATKICGLSKNKLLTSRNLPKYQPGGKGGKILIKRSELFHWIESTRVLELDLEEICKKALDGLRKKKPTST